MGSYHMMYFPSVFILLSVLVMKECCVLSDAFFASVEMIMRFFPPSFVMLSVSIALTHFPMLNHPCTSINPTWSYV